MIARGTALAMLSLVLCTASASARHSPEDDLARALAGRTPGPPTDCIEQSRVNGPDIIDSRNIIYRQSGRRIWRNMLPENCPSLQPDRILIIEVQGAQLCRQDRFRTLTRSSSIPGPYCRLGRFTPYDKPH